MRAKSEGLRKRGCDIAFVLLLDGIFYVPLGSGARAEGPRHQIHERLRFVNQRLVEDWTLSVESERREESPLQIEDALTPNVLVIPGQQRE
ncbi:hypothetical protein [Streptomyces phaeochromogenes]|uniref:hypothetical protein n=1 Tax=Streptomyces phaeochromogenes TaxID=1923 RepID=UPI002DD8FCB1|nr:hypothetical protein [Streptomyces phaeochromogenes]WRZ34694.1 hypothetical protein OG931_46650 [Streptomyces phaeochromogenes]